MLISQDKLKQILVPPGHVSEADFEAAKQAARQENKELDLVLTEQGLIRDDQLGQLLAEAIQCKFVNVREQQIDNNLFYTIPEIVARSRGVVALNRTGGGIRVGMLDPRDLEMRHLLTKRFGEPILPFLVSRQGFEEAMRGYKQGLSEEINFAVNRLDRPGLDREERNRLIVHIVDLILEYAGDNQASDIHIEPYENRIAVRFRIDGVMHNILDLPKSVYEPVLMRIKILSRLRIDEHRSAQDGKFQFKSHGRTIDVRVSVVPVTNGENMVMRLLSAEGRQLSLDSLGFSRRDREHLERAARAAQGMILVSGPTGSGKTTTMYELIKHINTEEINIATIEDPVEYDIEGISQIQVNTRTNLGFAQGLRAIVRQDPDVILVGEIRDAETAQIAVNSAMTGHLVLSTLHANDAATTLPRFLDLGVEPYLIASTVNVAIGQRLVRRLCQSCRYSYPIGNEDKSIILNRPSLKDILVRQLKKDIDKLTLYKADGCDVCQQSGYKGRVGLYEVMPLSEEVKGLVIKRSPSGAIKAAAVAEGMTTITADGLMKAVNGLTTLAEVIRVTGGLE